MTTGEAAEFINSCFSIIVSGRQHPICSNITTSAPGKLMSIFLNLIPIEKLFKVLFALNSNSAPNLDSSSIKVLNMTATMLLKILLALSILSLEARFTPDS